MGLKKRCACGLTYDYGSWRTLTLVGHGIYEAEVDLATPLEWRGRGMLEEVREMRNCVCGSTLTRILVRVPAREPTSEESRSMDPSTLQRESAIRTLVEALRASERRRSELAHRSLPSAPTTFRHKDGRPSWVFEGPWIVEGPLVSLTIQDRTEAALLARKLTERCARKEER